MIRLYLTRWARVRDEIVPAIHAGVEAAAAPAVCSYTYAPADKAGEPSGEWALVVVEAAADFPWAALLVPGVTSLPAPDEYTSTVKRGEKTVADAGLAELGVTLVEGERWDAEAQRVQQAIHPEAQGLDRYLRGERTLARPSGTFTDAFTAGSDTNLESHTPSGGTAWTRSGGSAGAGLVVAATGTLRGTTSTTTVYFCDDQGAGDQYVQAELQTDANLNGLYLCARLIDSSNYIAWRQAGSGGSGSRLSKRVSGTLSDLISFNADVDDVLRIECEGTTVRMYKNGAQQGSDQTISDVSTSETSQGVIIAQNSTSPWIDDFEAGVLGGVAFDAALMAAIGRPQARMPTALIEVVPSGMTPPEQPS